MDFSNLPKVPTIPSLPSAGSVGRLAVVGGNLYVDNGSSWTNLSGGSGSPQGSNHEIQFNNNGVFGGVANVKTENGNLKFINTTDPATPPTDSLAIYAKKRGGRMLLKQKAPSGVDSSLQTSLHTNNFSLITAGSGTTASVIGCLVTNVGTVSHPVLATTNFLTQVRRFRNTSAATAGSLASTRIGVLECWRGNAVDKGGFFAVCRFGLATLQAGMRAFFGLTSNATTAPTNIDPTTSTAQHAVGMAINANSGNWKLIHNTSGTAPTVIDLGANFPVNTTDLLELVLYSAPNGLTIEYEITNLSTGNSTSDSLSTNLPAATAFLGRLMWACNNATAAAVAWDCAKSSLESNN